MNIKHSFSSDLVVKLISPSNTEYFVSNREGGSASDIILTNQSITAFDNQTAAGTWQLNVQDDSPGITGTLNSWSLTIVGNCPQTAHWSGTATPNLPTIDNGMACTSLTVPTMGGDSSVAMLDIFGNHDYRAILRGTLTHNGTTVEAFPTSTFSAGPGTFSFTNRVVRGLSGDSSGTWQLCIVDTDGFGDTGVLTAWSVHD